MNSHFNASLTPGRVDLTKSGQSKCEKSPRAVSAAGLSARRRRAEKEGGQKGRMKTEYLLNREVEHVLAALTPSNRLVLRVSLHTGLRVGDVLALRPAQLGPQFWITEQKTGKRRRVGLPAELLRELRSEAGEVWVFEGRNDWRKHRTRQAVWADVKRAQRAFRLPQNIGPHSFRKVYAVDLLRRYGDIDRVRRALNHRDVSVTMVYALADQLLRAKHKKIRNRA